MAVEQTAWSEDYLGDAASLADALRQQREYTLSLYASIPESGWTPSQFPYRPNVNPALWELAHIAWFQEYFALRLPLKASDTPAPSCAAFADELFDSRRAPHASRWTNDYPSREACLAYMRQTLARLLDALPSFDESRLQRAKLAVAHEDMHAEALLMTLHTLGWPIPPTAPQPKPLAGLTGELQFAGGDMTLGKDATRQFSFDNEKPDLTVHVAPFAIDARVISAAEWLRFRQSNEYHDARLWTPAGNQWREAHRQESRSDGQRADGLCADSQPAMHISLFEAEAWCRAAQRRLPTEAEWEFAAVHSMAFRESTGLVWEWTASPFAPRPGFVPGVYAEYSEPWFHDHQVLKGGSFATVARLRYPQYRNFYRPDRDDVFCGFRTCAIG